MSRCGWSRLYPKAWRNEFGQEFDAMTEQMKIGPREVFDMCRGAFGVRLAGLPSKAPFLFGWLVIGALNIVAKEVQWPAGVLLLAAAVATIRKPRRWLQSILFFASAIPISTLYVYQQPGGHHEPLYHTVVALIPASVGAVIGLAIGAMNASPEPGMRA